MLEPIINEIRVAAADEFWFVVTLLVLACLGGIWMWFRSMKRARLIEDTPTSRCRSAAQGYVELIGTQQLMPGDPIRAPLTGRQCTWWEYCIEEKRTTYSKGRSKTRWVTIDKGVSESLFLIRDDTGDAVIDPDGAEVIPSASDTWYGSSHWPKGPPVGGSIFGGRYRYKERRMHEADMLYAIGFFQTHSAHHQPAQRAQEAAQLLAEWKRDQRALLQRFDANQDGQIDVVEWEKARELAQAQINSRIREEALDPGVHVMSRPSDGRPFILSVVPETDLTRRFRRHAVAWLSLFFAAGAASVFAISVRLTT